MTYDELLALCHAGGRVCLMPSPWNQLWKLLPDRRPEVSGCQPAMPLILSAWHTTSEKDKRTRFIEHLEWARDHGALEDVSSFVVGLSPADWNFIWPFEPSLASLTSLPVQLIAAYFATDYGVQVGETKLVIRIGQSNPALAACLSHESTPTGAYLTAWNPEGEACSEGENDARHQELEATLRMSSVPFLRGSGQGRDGRWPAEDSVLAVGLSLAQAVDLGHRFAQNAFVWIPGPQADAELILLR
jgi:hypothetical protein